jgi:nicotinate-nucleotide adenylyltransferase
LDKLLLFGGSFNPVHHGHLIVARYVTEHLGVARTILIPSAAPPHKQDQQLAPAEQRLALCRLAVTDDAQFEVSDWEISQPGPNYTIRTIEHFRSAAGPTTELYWLIGMDSLHELPGWHRAAELVDLCTIVTAARPGFEPPPESLLARRFSAAQIKRLRQHIVEGPHIDIASSDIRARVQAGLSIRYLVPEAVREYVQRLYGRP